MYCNKYPKSDKIYEVKIWRNSKTDMRLENDALAVNNLRKLSKEIKFKDQIFADAKMLLLGTSIFEFGRKRQCGC